MHSLEAKQMPWYSSLVPEQGSLGNRTTLKRLKTLAFLWPKDEKRPPESMAMKSNVRSMIHVHRLRHHIHQEDVTKCTKRGFSRKCTKPICSIILLVGKILSHFLAEKSQISDSQFNLKQQCLDKMGECKYYFRKLSWREKSTKWRP